MKFLVDLSQLNQFLYQGSKTAGIKKLEPRQAYNALKKDGLPAVCLSDNLEVAIFMAILGSRKLGAINYKASKIYFYILGSKLEQAMKEDWQGYVYLINKDLANYIKHSHYEWRTIESVEPIDCIKVPSNDLPRNIVLLDNYGQYKQALKD